MRKRLGAPGVLAFVGFLAGVGSDVLLEVTQLGESAVTERTDVRFDSEMNASVLRQIGRIGKALVAGGALIGLRVCPMHLLAVNQQVRL